MTVRWFDSINPTNLCRSRFGNKAAFTLKQSTMP